MKAPEVLAAYHSVLTDTNPQIYTQPLRDNPLLSQSAIRKNSVSIEDAFFGDSGKGSVTDKFNHMLSPSKRELISLRYNGGANAGHEIYRQGERIVTHQLPIGVLKEGATAIITRGMVIHPEDLLAELAQIEAQAGGRLPGNLVIDERTPLALDTHRAREYAERKFCSGSTGSTGKGISPAYEDILGRRQLTLKDLLKRDSTRQDSWEKEFRQHYQYTKAILQGLGVDLPNAPVSYFSEQKGNTRPVGTEDEFIDRLERTRNALQSFSSKDIYNFLSEFWQAGKIPFTIEGAQGAGLDPYHGVYPDITASRPMSHNIQDATYGIIRPEEIGFRTAVMKTTYMSSVGIRRLPAEVDKQYEAEIRERFDEVGRSTGRPRDIYPVSIPIARYLRRVSGYEYVVATHLDASDKNQPFKVITHYTDRITGKEVPYSPYQDHLDNLVPHCIEFPGWDGEEVKQAKSPDDLPVEARQYLAFLSETIAPVAYGTTGPELGDHISWLPKMT